MDNQAKPKFYKTKTFQNLNDKWYKKLKKDGFKDIESGVPSEIGELRLLDWSRSKFTKSVEWNQSKQEYYRLAGQFLYHHIFQTEEERKIWELHQDGVSVRNIVKTLKKQKIKAGHVKVFNTIKSLASIMVCQWKTNQK